MNKQTAQHTNRFKLTCLRLMTGSLIWLGLGISLLVHREVRGAPDWLVISATETPLEFGLILTIPFIAGAYLLFELKSRWQSNNH